MKKRIKLTESQLHNIIRRCVNESVNGHNRINEGGFKNALLAGAMGLSSGLGMSDQSGISGGMDTNDECPQGVVCNISSDQYGDIEITRNYDEYFADINSKKIPLGSIVSCGSGYNGANKSLNFDNAKLEWVSDEGNDVVFTLGNGTEISGVASKESVVESRIRSIVRRCINEMR